MLNDVVNSVSSVSLVSAGSSHMDLQLEAPHKLLMHTQSLASIGCLMQPVTLPLWRQAVSQPEKDALL